MSDTVVAIVSAFFVIGIVVGIIAVVAMSALRADRRGDPGDSPDYGPPGPGEQPPVPRADGVGLDDRPRWPGGADNEVGGS